MIKRIFDILFSFIMLLFLFPIFLIIALLIKRDSKGPVFYRGERVGKDGRLFKMYKFRTMKEDADKMGGGPSCPDSDARITKFGKLMRKYKLNELPQLINVLKGEMKLKRRWQNIKNLHYYLIIYPILNTKSYMRWYIFSSVILCRFYY